MSRVTSVMTANPACCTPQTSLREVAQMMIKNDCGQIPVVDDQKAPLGVVTDRAGNQTTERRFVFIDEG